MNLFASLLTTLCILYLLTHKMIYLFLILICILIMLYSNLSIKCNHTERYKLTKGIKNTHTYTPSHIDIKKPYLWMYWEIKNNRPIPNYIQLCFKIIKKNSRLFNLIILDNNTVLDYLPNLRKDINELPLALKADYIRILLLHKYGGLWLDCDVIMMTDLKEIVNLLNNNLDYIGFGCTGITCYNGYRYPSNWAIGAKKNSILMERCKYELDKKLDNYFSNADKKELDYHEFGKLIIWKCLDDLINYNDYSYYHFSSDVDGTRDKDGNWIALDLIMEKNIELLDESKLLIVPLVNSAICSKDPVYSWFCDLSEEEILNGNYFVTKLFRRAIEYKVD